MNLRKMLFPSHDAEETSQAAQPTCPAGHALDPTWGGVCPYCESAARAKEKTQAASRFDMPPPTASASGRETRIADAPAPTSRRETKVDSDDDSSYKAPPDGRRITGVLATFSWKASGEVFLVREGKTTIGAGNIADEGRPCDVQIRTDPEMSKEHALILCRQGRYELVDLNSSNGTFLEGQMIPSHAVELENDARIKVGATVFQFLRIEGGRTGDEPRPERMPEPDDDEPPRREPGPPDRLTSIE